MWSFSTLLLLTQNSSTFLINSIYAHRSLTCGWYDRNDAPRLLPELVDRVIDILQDDILTLYACALTCRSWYPRSHHYLSSKCNMSISTYRHFDFVSRILGSPKTRKYLRGHKQLLITEDKAQPFCRTFPIRIPGHHQQQVESIVFTGADWTRLHPRFFSHLTCYWSINELALHQCSFLKTRTLQGIVDALINLKTLHLRQPSFRQVLPFDHEIQSRAKSRDRTLQTVTLEYVDESYIKLLCGTLLSDRSTVQVLCFTNQSLSITPSASSRILFQNVTYLCLDMAYFQYFRQFRQFLEPFSQLKTVKIMYSLSWLPVGFSLLTPHNAVNDMHRKPLMFSHICLDRLPPDRLEEVLAWLEGEAWHTSLEVFEIHFARTPSDDVFWLDRALRSFGWMLQELVLDGQSLTTR